MGLTDFFLAGHSFGGYCSGLYASRYPQHIKKLLLLSPLGLKPAPENYDIKNMRFMNGRGPPKWAISLSKLLWGKVSPFAVLRKISWRSAYKALTKYVEKHQPTGSIEEKEALIRYMYQILLGEGTSEYALFK